MANVNKSNPSYLEDLIFPHEIKAKLIQDNNLSWVTIIITGLYEKDGYDKLIKRLRTENLFPLLITDFGQYVVQIWESECLSELHEVVKYSFKFVGYETKKLNQ